MSADGWLPAGVSCVDCAHFVRCAWLIQCDGGNVRCEWYPSRFVWVGQVVPHVVPKATQEERS